MDSRFYSCRKCGVIVGLVEGSLNGVTCDGEPLEMMRANSVDASREKHVPVVSVAESIVSVKIGSAEHPMTAAHHISCIISAGFICRPRRAGSAGLSPLMISRKQSLPW